MYNNAKELSAAWQSIVTLSQHLIVENGISVVKGHPKSLDVILEKAKLGNLDYYNNTHSQLMGCFNVDTSTGVKNVILFGTSNGITSSMFILKNGLTVTSSNKYPLSYVPQLIGRKYLTEYMCWALQYVSYMPIDKCRIVTLDYNKSNKIHYIPRPPVGLVVKPISPKSDDNVERVDMPKSNTTIETPVAAASKMELVGQLMYLLTNEDDAIPRDSTVSNNFAERLAAVEAKLDKLAHAPSYEHLENRLKNLEQTRQAEAEKYERLQSTFKKLEETLTRILEGDL